MFVCTIPKLKTLKNYRCSKIKYMSVEFIVASMKTSTALMTGFEQEIITLVGTSLNLHLAKNLSSYVAELTFKYDQDLNTKQIHMTKIFRSAVLRISFTFQIEISY